MLIILLSSTCGPPVHNRMIYFCATDVVLPMVKELVSWEGWSFEAAFSGSFWGLGLPLAEDPAEQAGQLL